jgi:hypothetical protein
MFAHRSGLSGVSFCEIGVRVLDFTCTLSVVFYNRGDRRTSLTLQNSGPSFPVLSHRILSLPIPSMNARSGTLIDIELRRNEFTAAIEPPPFRKGNHESETGEGATDLSDVEGSG